MARIVIDNIGCPDISIRQSTALFVENVRGPAYTSPGEGSGVGAIVGALVGAGDGAGVGDGVGAVRVVAARCRQDHQHKVEDSGSIRQTANRA